MRGDTVRVAGEEYEIWFDGRQALLPPRASRRDPLMQVQFSHNELAGLNPSQAARGARYRDKQRKRRLSLPVSPRREHQEIEIANQLKGGLLPRECRTSASARAERLAWHQAVMGRPVLPPARETLRELYARRNAAKPDEARA